MSWLVVTRAVWVAGLLGVFGNLTFQWVVLPCVPGGNPAPVRAACWTALALAGIGWVAWVLAQSAALAGVDGMAAAIGVVPLVLRHSLFGRLMVLQAVGLAVAAGTFGRRSCVSWPSLAAAWFALGMQAGHGHGAAMASGGVNALRAQALLGLAVVHLAAAGGWLGGLPPLLAMLRAGRVDDQGPAVAALRWFSPLGQVCVLGTVGSAMLQSWLMLGRWSGLATPYGSMLLVKTGLFGVLLGFALAHRHWLGPALASGRATPAHLAWTLGAQTLAGLGVVLASALLSGLAPPMAMPGS